MFSSFFYDALTCQLLEVLYDKLNLKYHSFSLCCEVPIKAKLKGYKIKEIPSKERARSGGISKVNAFKDGLIILFDMLKLFFDRSSYR